MKREENMKFEKKNLKILFFSIFKKFIKNSNNIPSISAMRFWVTVRKLNVTDGRTDGQTDGGRCNISRPGPTAGDKKDKSYWTVFEKIDYRVTFFPFDPMLIFRPPKIPVTVIESHYISF